MAPRVDPVPPAPTPLPPRTDVVVIGGGIIGASTALYLAEKGIAVTLCEKGEVGAEQSSRARQVSACLRQHTQGGQTGCRTLAVSYHIVIKQAFAHTSASANDVTSLE